MIYASQTGQYSAAPATTTYDPGDRSTLGVTCVWHHDEDHRIERLHLVLELLHPHHD